jgi:hypothetical protein
VLNEAFKGDKKPDFNKKLKLTVFLYKLELNNEKIFIRRNRELGNPLLCC